MQTIGQNLLLAAARAARRRAYAPYSEFHVGAALQTVTGRIFRGCNVENASFGLTLCAERVALCSAVAAGQRHFRALALVAEGCRPPMPCGACLQTLAEFCAPDFLLISATAGRTPKINTMTLGDLLPRAFQLAPGCVGSQQRKKRC